MIQTPTVVFLDRDGTIIRDTIYLSSADDVELLPGAAQAIHRLNEIGTPVIVITNQSGIAQGKFTVDDYLLTETRVNGLLAEHGARIDATYYCPDHPDFTGPCGCRKPGTALFERAVVDHGLDMTSASYVGDRWRDIAPFGKLGGRPILIVAQSTPPEDVENATREGVSMVASLARAVDLLIGTERT